MQILCECCNNPILDGDKVSFFGTAVFRVIPSEIVYAFDDDSMNIEMDSIAHLRCPFE